MNITKELFKYGYSNFKLEIIEYCNVSVLLEREQYYLDILKPEYNILKIAGSNLGFKHAEETLTKIRGHRHSEKTRVNMSAVKQGKNHPFFGKHSHSEETLASDSQKAVDRSGVKNPMHNKVNQKIGLNRYSS